jgi:hypothetical protein
MLLRNFIPLPQDEEFFNANKLLRKKLIEHCEKFHFKHAFAAKHNGFIVFFSYGVHLVFFH